ncbi:hypothetical protein RHSIM_Rhsim10G0000900 [Rhododendron simsii]|uniref:Uncharacterized protein n=1 Tax=Rhododendron simsii TaxID=118357 RepID=A0A834GDN8_RHOSS|nr:hypothetical protein RHSIM_Rhsim10G0000900 [Rhododendron simsii]
MLAWLSKNSKLDSLVLDAEPAAPLTKKGAGAAATWTTSFLLLANAFLSRAGILYLLEIIADQKVVSSDFDADRASRYNPKTGGGPNLVPRPFEWGFLRKSSRHQKSIKSYVIEATGGEEGDEADMARFRKSIP